MSSGMTNTPSVKDRDSNEQEQFLTILSREDALARFEAALFPRPVPAETRPLADALGCALAEDVMAPIDVPPFDRSNVDGFAVRSADLASAGEASPVRLLLNDEVIACGTGPPVAIDVAVPDNTGRVGAVPQAITSSFSIRRTGDASPAEARSAERTAKPSTLERSNGGTSIGATTSSASAQPSASASGRVSAGTGRGNKAASKRVSASSRDRIVRNWS